jgi:hypothetical protein
MKTSFAVASIISSAIVSALLLSAAVVQAAPSRAELDEVNYAQTLKEAGYTFPAIEKALRARKATSAGVASEKVSKAQAVPGADEKVSVRY